MKKNSRALSREFLTMCALCVGASLGIANVAFADEASQLFDKKCASCHGKDGKGNTAIGKKIGTKNFADPALQGNLTDAAIEKSILAGEKDKDTGKNRMPGFEGKLSSEEISGLVKYVRTFRGKE